MVGRLVTRWRGLALAAAVPLPFLALPLLVLPPCLALLDLVAVPLFFDAVLFFDVVDFLVVPVLRSVLAAVEATFALLADVLFLLDELVRLEVVVFFSSVILELRLEDVERPLVAVCFFAIQQPPFSVLKPDLS